METKKIFFKNKKLIQLRDEAGLSHDKLSKELYKKVGLTVTSVSIRNWETNVIPNADALYSLHLFFNKPLEYFFKS